MPRVVNQPNLMAIIKDLQKRISILENTARLTASSIKTNGNSRFSVHDSNNNTLSQTGDINAAGGGTVPGLATYRPSGTPAFASAQGASLYQLSLLDAAGNLAVATNETTGYGLQTPFIDFTMYPVVTALIPSTTAGTDTSLWSGGMPQSHSYFDIRGTAAVTGGATGTFTLNVGGVNIGTITVTTGVFVAWAFNNTSVGASPVPNAVAAVNITGKITSGAGTLVVAVTNSFLHGS